MIVKTGDWLLFGASHRPHLAQVKTAGPSQFKAAALDVRADGSTSLYGWATQHYQDPKPSAIVLVEEEKLRGIVDALVERAVQEALRDEEIKAVMAKYAPKVEEIDAKIRARAGVA